MQEGEVYQLLTPPSPLSAVDVTHHTLLKPSPKKHWGEMLWLGVLIVFLLNLAYLMWPEQTVTVTVEPHPETFKNLPVLVQTQPSADAQSAYALVKPDTNSATPIHAVKAFHHGEHGTPKKDFHGIIHINTAGIEAFQKLPGIGAKMAERIITYRKTQGAFKSCEDLQNVNGIGPKKFEKIQPLCQL